MLEHPVIEQINRTGYPFSDRREEYGTDGLGNEVFKGEEILVLDDEFFLVEELSMDAIEILEILDADYEIAK